MRARALRPCRGLREHRSRDPGAIRADESLPKRFGDAADGLSFAPSRDDYGLPRRLQHVLHVPPQAVLEVEAGEPARALVCVLVSVGGGLVAAVAGYALGRALA